MSDPARRLAGALLLVATTAGSQQGPAQDPQPSQRRPAATSQRGPSTPAQARVWTTADIARLPRTHVSVAGTGETREATTPSDATQAVMATKPGDWSAKANALRTTIAMREAQLAQVEKIRESWTSYVLGTGEQKAQAAHELGELRELEKLANAEITQARGELVLLEESARKQGVPPGDLR